jgi:hypothetical protein
VKSFAELFEECRWRPIRGCSGRFVLEGGPSRLPPAELAGEGVEIRSEHCAGTEDEVFSGRIPGGGIISYRKPDGSFIHTLSDEEGFLRKTRMLGIGS